MSVRIRLWPQMKKVKKVKEWARDNSKDYLFKDMPEWMYNAYFKKGFLNLKDVSELISLGYGWIAMSFSQAGWYRK